MKNNKITDKVFEAAAKLELMHTLVGVLINRVDVGEITTPEEAMYFASCKNEIKDLLCIALDGIVEAETILSGIGKEGDAA